MLLTTLSFARSFWHSTIFPKVIQSGKGLSPSRIWFSFTGIHWCNDVSFFNEFPCTPIFPRSFPVKQLFALHFHHFLADFNFFHTAYVVKMFSTVFLALSMLVVSFLYCRYHSTIWSPILGIVLSPCFSPFSSQYTSVFSWFEMVVFS